MIKVLIHFLSVDVQVSSSSEESTAESTQSRCLLKLSIMTGMALVIHNFPEGMATFSETLRDEGAGIALAVAIGIHNIPEGGIVCVFLLFHFCA